MTDLFLRLKREHIKRLYKNAKVFSFFPIENKWGGVTLLQGPNGKKSKKICGKTWDNVTSYQHLPRPSDEYLQVSMRY